MKNAAASVEELGVRVYGPEPVTEQREEPKPKLTLLKKRKTGTRMKTVLWVAFIFAAFFLVTSRYSNLTKLNYEISDIKSNLEQQKSINSALRVELDQKTNIMTVRHLAETELGMSEPANSQLIYITVPRANKVVVEQETPETSEKTIGFIENIRAFIGGN